ncbi:MAG TPA: POTRA domain-containing protein, partial [Polyangia bacterium]|nr:POTRA domain-containing protein [Polyangia bacterium]
MRPALAIVVVLCASTAVVRAQGQPQPTTPQPTTPTTSQPPPSPSVDTPLDTASTERLSGIELEGRISDSKPALLGFLGLRVGAPFGQVEQNRLNQLLGKLGYRQLDTRLDVTGPGLVRLHLVLEPVRIVRNLVVKHDWPLFDDEIIRHLSVRTNQPLPADAELRGFLDNEAENIRKFLFNEGYFEATVKIEPRLALDWQHVHHHYERKIRSEWIDLLITLDLGSSYKLEGVVATYDHADGPTHLSESRLMEIFGHWLRFKVSQMREDQRKTEKLLRDSGYPAARVTCDFEFERDADKKTHRIKLPVRIALKRKVEVHFVGNRAITPAELREQLTIFSAGAYDEVELTESAKAVQREYQKHGYFEAKVTFRRALRRPPVDESGQPKGDEVEDITFTVEEGPELKVRRVELVSESGAPLRIDPAETKSKAELETKPFPTLGAIGLGEGGYVTQLQLSQDADRIATYYKSRGFPLVKVRSEVARDPAAFDALGVFAAEVSGAGGGGDVYVRFYIDEGRKESVGHTEVTFVGPHVKSEFDIFKALKLNMGDPYTEQAEIEDKDRLIALYKTSGHPYVTIDPTKSEWDAGHDRVTLRYIITEGPEVRFGDILVRGNFKTTVFAIRRDLPFKVGDLFDFRKIEAAERNLQTHLIFNVARVEAQFPAEHPVVTSAVPILVTV